MLYFFGLARAWLRVVPTCRRERLLTVKEAGGEGSEEGQDEPWHGWEMGRAKRRFANPEKGLKKKLLGERALAG